MVAPSSETTFEARLQAVNEADSAQGLLDAVEALADLNDQRSIPTLIQVLGFNNPGAAVAAVEGLVQIGIPAVSPLLDKLDGYNYGARAWAIRALAGIGDPRGLDLILETAAEDFSLSVRRAAARGLGSIQWEKLEKADRREGQIKARNTLLQVAIDDPEWVVRYAATVGLQGVATAAAAEDQPDLLPPIADCLRQIASVDETVAVRARAEWAIAQLQLSV